MQETSRVHLADRPGDAPHQGHELLACRIFAKQPDQFILETGKSAQPGTDHVAYTLTKAALIAMTKSLAQALAPDIQVNAIAPGLILPPPGQGREYLERAASGIPAQRPGSAGEIVKALLYLLESDFVTGELIYVTGGEHLLTGRER